MIALWSSFYLADILGYNYHAWWAIPFCVTAYIAVTVELLVEFWMVIRRL